MVKIYESLSWYSTLFYHFKAKKAIFIDILHNLLGALAFCLPL